MYLSLLLLFSSIFFFLITQIVFMGKWGSILYFIPYKCISLRLQFFYLLLLLGTCLFFLWSFSHIFKFSMTYCFVSTSIRPCHCVTATKFTKFICNIHWMYSVQCTPVRYRKLWIGNLIIFYNDVVFLMFFDHFTYLFSSGVFFERKKKNTKINSKSLKHLYFAKNCVYVQHYRIAKSTFVKLVSRQTCLYVYNVCVCVYIYAVMKSPPHYFQWNVLRLSFFPDHLFAKQNTKR